MPEFVSGKRVCSALNNHNIGDVKRADSAHDLLKEFEIGDIIHTFLQRDVGSVEFAHSFPDLIQCSCSWEKIFLKLMEAYCEDSVCVVECFFHSISMMHIDIKVKYSWISFQQLQDTQHDIVHITESTGL